MQKKKRALILVDIQNDFLTGGSLAVNHGEEILPVVQKLLKCHFDHIIATKDWHPMDHGSFAATHGKQPGEHVELAGVDQILWPVHCVQNTHGAEFAPGWDSSKVETIFYKGTEKDIDSYSTFFDNERRKSTGLDKALEEMGIKDIYIAGLATDYCVKYSVLDAVQLGFNTYVIVDGCRGVNLEKDDSKRALELMAEVGAHLIALHDVEINEVDHTKKTKDKGPGL